MTETASALVKTVPIKLDRERNLRLTLGDALRFKRATTSEARPEGISLLRGDLQRYELGEEEWLELFAAMLRHDDPEITPEHVGDIMDVDGFVRAGEALGELLAAFQTREPEGPRPTDPTPSPA